MEYKIQGGLNVIDKECAQLTCDTYMEYLQCDAARNYLENEKYSYSILYYNPPTHQTFVGGPSNPRCVKEGDNFILEVGGGHYQLDLGPQGLYVGTKDYLREICRDMLRMPLFNQFFAYDEITIKMPCYHECIDVGFTHHKWVCKHCDCEMAG